MLLAQKEGGRSAADGGGRKKGLNELRYLSFFELIFEIFAHSLWGTVVVDVGSSRMAVWSFLVCQLSPSNVGCRT
jgi:hypothetical protein